MVLNTMMNVKPGVYAWHTISLMSTCQTQNDTPLVIPLALMAHVWLASVFGSLVFLNVSIVIMILPLLLRFIVVLHLVGMIVNRNIKGISFFFLMVVFIIGGMGLYIIHYHHLVLQKMVFNHMCALEK
ncbi:hypothetical protein Hdeb2414_s0013g00409771 [Helianthus debilis subsp. tardiflorus]